MGDDASPLGDGGFNVLCLAEPGGSTGRGIERRNSMTAWSPSPARDPKRSIRLNVAFSTLSFAIDDGVRTRTLNFGTGCSNGSPSGMNLCFRGLVVST